MSEALDAVRHAALKLDEAERMLLAADLMESITSNPRGLSIDDPEFLDELERRSSDLSAAIPWQKVRVELRAELGK